MTEGEAEPVEMLRHELAVVRGHEEERLDVARGEAVEELTEGGVGVAHARRVLGRPRDARVLLAVALAVDPAVALRLHGELGGFSAAAP